MKCVCFQLACQKKQIQLYLITGQSAPHLSVIKATEQKWEEIGLFVRKCISATDWIEKPNGQKHSRNAGVFMEKHEHGSISATDIHPVLAEIPPKLWAKHKYDVGLIKGCEPVVITPKSDYRPCQSQYPLKKEALRGIQPVFESLLKERVIIPCHDSPVRTPIFPVKKITSNTSEPVTWRFVQDLQAVNSAVIARAARVPNPYTILSQIPQNAMYFTVVDLANAFFSVPVEGKKSVLVRVWFWQQRVHVYQVVSGLLWVSDDLQWSAQTEPWTINSIERNGAIAVYRLFIDLCTRWGYVRGWQCNSLEPSGERGSQGQSDKATVLCSRK